VSFVTAWLRSQPESLDLRDSKMPVSKLLRLISVLPYHSSLTDLHIPCSALKGSSADETRCVLNALKDVLPKMQDLRVLGLHRVQLCSKNLREISCVLNILKDNLEGLALSLTSWQARDEQEKVRLFEAVARLNKLHTFALPQWKAFVGGREAVLAPLRKYGELLCLVDGSTDKRCAGSACAMVPGLHFMTADGRRFKP
jgi:hypothetical protein